MLKRHAAAIVERAKSHRNPTEFIDQHVIKTDNKFIRAALILARKNFTSEPFRFPEPEPHRIPTEKPKTKPKHIIEPKLTSKGYQKAEVAREGPRNRLTLGDGWEKADLFCTDGISLGYSCRVMVKQKRYGRWSAQ